MKTTTRWTLAVGVALTAILGGTATAQATGPATGHTSGGHSRDTALATAFGAVDRNTAWQQTSKLKLNFPTFHTEGIAFAGDRIFLSSVEIIEPTVKYPTPQNGYDRSPGKGIGHLFVMDRQGNLQKDLVLGEGDMYHPGGIDFDGTNVWVPVAQYRPDSSTIVYRVDTSNLAGPPAVRGHRPLRRGGTRQDHRPPRRQHLGIATLRGVERIGQTAATWDNANFFVDYQDCQYVPNGQDALRWRHQPAPDPHRRRQPATYELGGLALIDLRQPQHVAS